jgi:hypothetical protein
MQEAAHAGGSNDRDRMPVPRSDALPDETIGLLKATLVGVWESLMPQQQAAISPSLMVKRIVALASIGERDPLRLGLYALTGVEPPATMAGWTLHPAVVGEPVIDRFVSRLNVEHFEKLLIKETDEAKRRFLHSMLAAEEGKLAVFAAPTRARYR